MKLSAAQFGALHTLAEFGPKTATEVVLPPAMDGKRRVKLEWNVATAPTLAKLEDAGFVSVERQDAGHPTNAVGIRGRKRIALTIAITDAGRAALAVS